MDAFFCQLLAIGIRRSHSSFLIVKGVDPNVKEVKDTTPLHLAMKLRNIIMKQLIAIDAVDPEWKHNRADMPADSGTIPVLRGS
ncbi:hypothetical protein BDV38DRAFT_252767 [Aspergillus pseudotamarii]|uniref:Ankyrin repeat-containing domain protein n=1 Tax=Aspergillus pseudotamarii TaxID=132259 RepID=A0A5N6SNE2_ASPPS|nr:uncharacterized protein BDV38DRAFT_252767 [Aspergillus pseudotamarii]KAE8135221.1 hypothetical protein BDV38DRAFT_252767 [Aspergillus pseudotamarii]